MIKIITVFIKFVNMNYIRNIYLALYKYQKYYLNGREIAFTSDEYQLSFIKLKNSTEIFINEKLKSLLKSVKLFGLIDEEEIIKSYYIKKRSPLSCKNDVNSSHKKAYEFNLNKKIISKTINYNHDNSKQQLILDTYYRSVSNKKPRISADEINNILHSNSSEEEKILNLFFQKILPFDLKPLFSNIFKENNMDDLYGFCEIMKILINNISHSNGESNNNNEDNKNHSLSTFKGLHSLEKILSEKSNFLEIGSFYLPFSYSVKILLEVEMRYIKELGIIDIIIRDVDHSYCKLKNLKNNFPFEVNKNRNFITINNKCNCNNDPSSTSNFKEPPGNQDISGLKGENTDKTFKQTTTYKHEISDCSMNNIDIQSHLKFFSKMTHEFKTPINSIIGLINKIKTSLTNPLNGSNENNLQEKTSFEEDLNLIFNLSNYTIYLINDVIQYSQIGISANLIKFNIEPINLREILEFCYSIGESILNCNQNKKNSVKLLFEFAKEIEKYIIRSDEIRLKQIMLNLISNSIKFTKRGSILIKAEPSIDKKTVYVSVVDTGLGIKEADIGKLFHENVMLKDKEHLNSFGSGLGLSIIKNLTEKMGIKIFIESKFNIGSCFKLEIPCRSLLRNLSDAYTIKDIDLEASEKYSRSITKLFQGPIINIKKSSSMVNKNLLNMIAQNYKAYKNKTVKGNADKLAVLLDTRFKTNRMADSLIKNNSRMKYFQNDSLSDKEKYSDNPNLNRSETTKIYNSEPANSIINNHSPIKNIDAPEIFIINSQEKNLNVKSQMRKYSVISNLANAANEQIVSQIENNLYSGKLCVSPNSYRNSFTENTTKINENILFQINQDDLSTTVMDRLENTNSFIKNMDFIKLKQSYSDNSNEKELDNKRTFRKAKAIKSKIKKNQNVENYYKTNYKYCCSGYNDKQHSSFISSSHANNIFEKKVTFEHDKDNKNFPKILIVDDNQFIRESFKKIITDIQKEKKLNFTVIEGNDGIDILNHIIADQTYGLLKCVFTDENMEYLNGTEAIKIVRGLEKNNKISKNIIVSMTSYEDENSKSLILDSGADYILSKPYSKNQIITTLVKFNLITF